MIYFTYIGLCANLIGSLFLAFSVSENPGGAHQLVEKKKVFLTVINKRRFNCGVWFLVGGFIIQLVGTIL